MKSWDATFFSTSRVSARVRRNRSAYFTTSISNDVNDSRVRAFQFAFGCTSVEPQSWPNPRLFLKRNADNQRFAESKVKRTRNQREPNESSVCWMVSLHSGPAFEPSSPWIHSGLLACIRRNLGNIGIGIVRGGTWELRRRLDVLSEYPNINQL